MWKLTDIVQDKPVKVFSLFSCGGGSSMGYKRAGFEVVGNVELDSKINDIYVKNFHPKYNYNMDVRDFLDVIPEEIKGIDILDMSPPCSTFSSAGQREKAWGVAKKFREGQKAQTLDDLFMVALEIVEKVQPKIVIAENVKGLIKGNAKGYVNEIIHRFHELGYEVQMFLLNAAFMGVPQQRERVFFIANKMNYPKLKLEFNEKPITYGEIKSGIGKKSRAELTQMLVDNATPTDNTLADVRKRLGMKPVGFSDQLVWDNKVPYTLVASGGSYWRGNEKESITDEDVINIQTFPSDYDFNKMKPRYVCGMSVPPVMMEKIAKEIWEQWLKE